MTTAGEAHLPAVHLSLMTKNVIFMIVFVVSLLFQLIVSRVQNEYVVVSVYENQEKIQAISSLMNNVGEAVGELEDFRWDYSDKASLIALIRRNLSQGIVILGSIEEAYPSDGIETYLLQSAVFTTFRSYQTLLGRLCSLLIENETARASSLYYSDLAPCSTYLGQYLQQYLDATIRDGSQTFFHLMQLNEKLQIYSLVSTLFCLASAFMVSLNLTRLVTSVTRLAGASASISRGDLFIPDFVIDRKDEIGRMELAFNEMKESLRNRLQLLEEKRQMEGELHRRETEALELQTLLEREKLQQLRSQMNPHFLFNTLNAITYSAQSEDARQTERLLTSLALFFRYTLASNDAQVLLSDEIRLMNEYHALICARFADRIRISWDYGDGIDPTDILVPSFMIQPLVENAIKHGLSRKEEGGTVTIAIRLENDVVLVSVGDDGVGMSEKKLESVRSRLTKEPKGGSQVGLYNVAARLSLMGQACSMSIESREGSGTCISIRFPLVRGGDDVQDTDR